MGLIQKYVDDFLNQKGSQWAREVITKLQWNSDEKIIDDLIERESAKVNERIKKMFSQFKELLFKYYNELDDLFDDYIERNGTDELEDYLSLYSYDFKITDFIVETLIGDLFNCITDYIIETYEEQYGVYLPYDISSALEYIKEEISNNKNYKCQCGNDRFRIICDYVSGDLLIREIKCIECGKSVEKEDWEKLIYTLSEKPHLKG